MHHSLTPTQLDLYLTLERLALKGRLFDPIIPIPVGASEYVIYVRGPENLRVRRISDLDALCEAGYLTYRLSRMGTTKHYHLPLPKTKVPIKESAPSLYNIGWRGQLVDQTQALKAALAQLLVGDLLIKALVEISFVQGQLNADSAELPPIYTAINTLTHLLTLAPPPETIEAFQHHNTALETLSQWANTISRHLATHQAAHAHLDRTRHEQKKSESDASLSDSLTRYL
jgi:hypothetical protein